MKLRITKLRAVGAGAVGAATILVGAGTASAHANNSHAPVVSAPIASDLAGPLQFEVTDWGKVLVAQSFSGTVSEISRKGVTDLFNDPGVDGVADGPWGSVIYTHTDGDTHAAELRIHTRKGDTRTLADLGAYEAANNPDGDQTYGLQGLSTECAAGLPTDQQLLPYQGAIDSHPYALKVVDSGVLVADAAANAILFVNWHGDIHTVAVLPPQAPITVTAEAATANHLPDCVVGSSFIAEPVPTDVEVSNGRLYVSTLPGGPEDPSLGARGSVYRINPWNGRVKQVATGFAGATNLAISGRGDIYVSELFGNDVAKVVGDHGVPIASVPSPTGLAWANGRLYVSINSLDVGQIVTITP